MIVIYAALLNRVPKTSNNQNAITYGSYVGLSMATGFLFLSGGMRTFGTSIEDGMYTSFCLATIENFINISSLPQLPIS